MSQDARASRLARALASAARGALYLEGAAFALAGIARQTSLVGIEVAATFRVASGAIALAGATACFLLAGWWNRLSRAQRVIVGLVELAVLTGYAGSWYPTRVVIVVTAALVSALTLVVPMMPHVRKAAR